MRTSLTSKRWALAIALEEGGASMSSDPYLDTVDELGAEERAKKERLAKLEIVSGASFLTTHYEEPKYLWQGVLPDAGLAICAASKAPGKTLLLLQLADAISRGR